MPAAENIQLVVFDFCPYCQRDRIVAEQTGLAHQVVPILPGSAPDWFKQASPEGKVPLAMIDGEPVLESAAIAELFDTLTGHSLMPDDPILQARVRRWVTMASDCQGSMGALIRAGDEAAYTEALQSLQAQLTQVAGELDADGPFFCGQQLTLADCAFAPLLLELQELDPDVPLYPADQPRLRRWAEAVCALPAVSRAVDDDATGVVDRLISRIGGEGHLARLLADAA